MSRAILLIECPDRKGIVKTITSFLADHGGNILELEQFVNAEENRFFMRVVWEMEGFKLSPEETKDEFAFLGTELHADWQISDDSQRERLALFVSGEPHCLSEVLIQHYMGNLRCEVPLIIGNQLAARDISKRFDIPFHYTPFEGREAEEVEAEQRALLEEHQIDLIGLARYMRILSPQFVAHYAHRIINIHHSFLPAFVGANPYRRAYDRGVKIIGATAHFVGVELDQGPIIIQETLPTHHSYLVGKLKKVGQEIEKKVFIKALGKQLEQKLIVYKNKTVVFE